MSDIVIFGTGLMTQVARVYLQRHSEHKIVGFTVDRKFINGDSYEGAPLVAWDELEAHFPPDKVKLLGPLTFKHLNTIRRDRYYEGLKRGYEFASFIHPDTHVYTDKIGDNCFILEANVIQPFTTIGNNVIIWSGNHIGHHSSIGDHTFMASHIGISGCVSIGEQCHLSGRAGIATGLTIGDRCALLNGAMVQHDLPDDSVMIGKPGEIKKYSSSRIARLI